MLTKETKETLVKYLIYLIIWLVTLCDNSTSYAVYFRDDNLSYFATKYICRNCIQHLIRIAMVQLLARDI